MYFKCIIPSIQKLLCSVSNFLKKDIFLGKYLRAETVVTIKYCMHLKIYKAHLYFFSYSTQQVNPLFFKIQLAHTIDDFTAELWLYYISEIPVASVNQRMLNIIPDRDTGI